MIRLLSVVLMLAASPLPAQETAGAGALRAPDAAQFVGAPKGTPLSGEPLYQRTQEVGALLRCPVCQGMSVADSPAEMAVNMKAQVSELLARGYTEAQILQYFELSYGEFVLLRPKFEGVNRMLWLLPMLALLIGGAVVILKFRSLQRQPLMAVASGDATVQSPIESDSDAYIARVRELVRGEEKR